MNLWAWWVSSPQSTLQTFNGTTYVFPKPSAKSTGKFATIKNFGLGDPDYQQQFLQKYNYLEDSY